MKGVLPATGYLIALGVKLNAIRCRFLNKY